MKILALRGSNLASLAQPFEIDFRREPLASAGVYAISGPTGSGKTTLLDAMCLALYHQTPRLAAHNAAQIPDAAAGETLRADDARQLLRRGAVSAYAEVDFRGNDGFEWRARWEVKRARGRLEGRLQPAEASLIELASGNRVGRTITEVREEIVRVIGLGFAQFTRAVLLAQNEFAAFLKADANTRAELLEALTGRSQFTQLSVAAFQRAREGEQELRVLQAELGQVAILDAEQRAALVIESEALDGRLKAQQTERAVVQSELQWWQRADELKLLQTQAERALLQAQADHQQAAVQRQQLADWQLGAAALPLLQAFDQASEQARHWQQRSDSLGQALATTEHLTLQLRGQREQDMQRLSAARAELQAAQPQIEAARQLDQQLLLTQGRVSDLSAQLQAARQELTEAQAQLQQQQRRREELSASRQLAEHWLRQHGLLEQLSGQWPALELRLQQALQQQQQVQHLETALGPRRELHEVLLGRQRQLRGQLEQLQAGLSVALIELAQASSALTEADPDRQREAEAYWQARRGQCQRALHAGQLWQGAHDSWLGAQTELAGLSNRQRQVGERRLALEHQLPLLTAAAGAADKRWQRARDAADDRSLVLRQTLEPGLPCAVCGSTEHPWAQQQPALLLALNELEQAAQAAADSWRQAQSEQATVSAEWLGLEQQIALVGRRLELQQQARQQTAEAFEQASVTLLDHSIVPDQWQERLLPLAHELDGQGELIEAWRTRCQTASERRERAQLDGRRQQEELDRTRSLLERQAVELQASQAALDAQQVQLAALRSELKQSEAELERSPWWPLLQHEWRDPAVALSRLGAAVSECAARRAQLSELQLAETQLEQQSQQLQSQLGQRLQPRHEQLVTALQQSSQQLGQWRQQRLQLLDQLDLDGYARQLQQRVAEAEWQLGQSSEQQQQSERELVRQRTEGVQLLQRMQEAELARQQAELALQRWWQALSRGPMDLEQLRRWSAIEPARLQAARALLVELDEQLRHAELAANQARQQAADWRLGGAAMRPAELLASLQTELDAEQQRLLEGRGRLRQLLDSDQSQAARQATLSASLEQRRAQHRIWAQLSELIGSADGAKFRRIAQQHTLQLVLAYANQQLLELAPRYRLQARGLELLVQDAEMGDELRSVNSLSGGESFLVSLALALGLAELTAQRVRVESLFIDEGFGSLDNDTLRVAVDALDRLQSLGRKVGVISHVAEMTERIGTRIRVRRLGHGRSVVDVPEA